MGICTIKNEKKTINSSIPPKKKKSKITFRETSDNLFESTTQSTPNSQEINIQSHNSTPKNKMLVSIDSNILINHNNRDPNIVYSKEKVLGNGSYGIVYLVKNKQLNKYFAMKTIKKKDKNKKLENTSLNNEIKILKSLDHPNILKITDFYETNTEYNIITEFCKEGELYKEIKSKSPFSEGLSAYYIREILKAVCYCHSNNIIHRDLKPENIMIFKKRNNGCNIIKIIDFGTATVFSKEKRENIITGTVQYIAPEVISQNYNEKSDLWSCGVILYNMLTGKYPFGGDSQEEISYKITRGKFDIISHPWNIISKEAKNLVCNLLIVDPNKRLSAKQALKHPWFNIEKVKKFLKMNELSENKVIKLIHNLINYRSDNILKSAVIAYLVHNNSQLKDYYDAIKLFNQIDEDGDGKISKEELLNGLQYYLESEGEKLQNDIDLIFNNIDTNHNNFIEYEEFIVAAIDKENLLSKNCIQFAFNYFDRGCTGEISLNEIKKLFYCNEQNKKDYRAREQLEECFKEVDVDNDGHLSFDEFYNMMKSILIF